MIVHRNRGAKRAREARAALGLDPLDPVPCLLTAVEDEAEVPVVVTALVDGFAGACWPGTEDGRRLLWVNAADDCRRQRFTLAHELGHLRCGHDGNLPVDTWTTLSGRTTSWVEVQANAFAGELLIPKEAVKAMDLDEPTLEQVVALAAVYGTSAYVALFRCSTAGCCSKQRTAELKAELDAEAHYALTPDEQVEDRLSEIKDGQASYLSAPVRGSVLEAAMRDDPRTPLDLRRRLARILAVDGRDAGEPG